MSHSLTEAMATKANLFLRALVGETVEVHCRVCGTMEHVVLLDDSREENELSNYQCTDCEL